MFGFLALLAIVAGWAVVLLWQEEAAKGLNDGKLFKLSVSQVIPDDLPGFFRLKFGLDRRNTVQPFVIILDGFQVAGSLDAFIEGGFGSLQDLVADAVLQAGQEELVFDKLEGVQNAFSLGLVDSGASESDGSHGGRLVVRKTLVGHLDAIGH
jgi:hypothetical protein